MFLYNLVDFPEFQSTLPRRERRNEIDFFLTSAYISIHAPAKGATNITRETRTTETDFNPRSREGSDSLCALMS